MNLDSSTTIQELKELLKAFRDARDWAQFHDAKNLAEAISIEAGELQELFLWKDKDMVMEKIKNDPEFRRKVEEELADIVAYALNFANATDIDLARVVKEKVEKNDRKYPVEKAKGSAKKYDEL
jgi:NTP pyrophosphatase (non-canonical NTP hydrolase)